MKLYVFLALLCFGEAACGQSASHHLDETIRTDVSVVETRLPKLGKLMLTKWMATQITIDSSFLPSHPVYAIKGYAILPETAVQKLNDQYHWQRAKLIPEEVLNKLGLERNIVWQEDPEFTKSCKPQQIPGKLLVCPEKQLVYFDIEVEK